MGRNQRSYYAVQKGKQQGVFATWDECKSNVSGYSGAKYKKFATLEEAQAFANQGSSSSSSSNSYYSSAKQGSSSSSSNNSYYSSANQGSSSSSSNNSYYSSAKQGSSSSNNSYYSSANRGSSSTSSSNNKYYSYVTSHSPTNSSPKVNQKPAITHTTTSHAAANTSAIKRERSWNDDHDTPASKTSKTVPTTKGQIVYTDGASRGNGSKGARAGYGVWWGDGDARNASGPLVSGKQTNQRAEATAILKVLQQTQDMPEQLEIRTDSQYCIKAMTEWHEKWQKNNWKSSTGNPVENKDLFEPMLELVKSRKGKTAFVYVPGHKGFYGNEQADALAVAGAQCHVKKEEK